jgi:hypothetical protein
LDAEKVVTKTFERFSLEGLGQDVCNHEIGRTVDHFKFARVEVLFDKEVANFDVLCTVGV